MRSVVAVTAIVWRSALSRQTRGSRHADLPVCMRAPPVSVSGECLDRKPGRVFRGGGLKTPVRLDTIRIRTLSRHTYWRRSQPPPS